MKYKLNDIVIDKYGRKRKVLEVGQNTYVLSCTHDFESANSSFTDKDLENYGYILHTSAPEDWTPEEGERYWYINDEGVVDNGIWDSDSMDHDRKNFLGVYRTKEQAEAKLVEIKNKLGIK